MTLQSVAPAAFISLISLALSAQEPTIRKGSLYATWGYNRAHYNTTDIHLRGEGYDFTLYDVVGHDEPEKFSAHVYMNPLKFTIPQFNFRVGFFLNENTSISFGWDHMKYHILQDQKVRIDGQISKSRSTTYEGVYDNSRIDITRDFLEFEHSDGMNFTKLAIERHQRFFTSKNERLRLYAVLGASAGLAVPWTETTLFGTNYDNWLHVAGWGVSGTWNLRLHYGNIFFLQHQSQYGYIRMGDILIENRGSGRAEHDLRFTESSLSIGGSFNIFGKKE